MKNVDLNAVRTIGDFSLLLLGLVLLFSPEQSRTIAGFMIILSSMRLLFQRTTSTPEPSTLN